MTQFILYSVLGLLIGAESLSCLAGPIELASDSPFGVCCPWPGLRNSGIKWSRVGAGATEFVNWPNIEKAPGTWDWTKAERELKDLDDPLELSLLPIFGYTPKWASSKPDDPDFQFYPPREVASFSRFMRQCVRRYQKRVQVWEVWNEPNIGFFRGSAAEYAEMVKAAAMAARQEDPNCRIAMGCAGIDIDFLQRLLEFGCGPYMDVASVHPYQWGREFNDRWMVDKLQSCRKLLDRFGQTSKPIWITEIGWSLGEGVSATEQANLLAQAIVTALSVRESLNLEKVFWFCVKDWGGPGHGLFDVKGQPKPAFNAYRAVISALSGAAYAGLWPGPKEVRGHVFLKGGEPAVVLWTPSPNGKSRVELPTSASRLRVRNLSNQVLELPVASGKVMVEATHAPVFIDGFKPGDFVGAKARPLAIKDKMLTRQPLGDVWLSVVSLPKTARPFFVLGGSNEFLLRVHNDGVVAARGLVHFGLDLPGGESVSGQVPFEMAPGTAQTVAWRSVFPASPKASGQLAPLRLHGVANGKSLLPIELPVRLTGGGAIEFAANSWIEKQYLHQSDKSACGDSIRFGSEFSYQFNLAGARSAQLRINAGANGGNPWSLLLSKDGKEFVEERSGKSWPSWQTLPLDKYLTAVPKSSSIYVKIKGQDCQVREVILLTESKK